MSHYAKVLNGTVTKVIVAEPDFFKKFVDTSPGTWIQTSYNTRGNVHYLPNSDTPSGNVALRGNYAGIGYIYDQTHDVFYPPQPTKANVTFTLNTTSWTWTANTTGSE
jgi:hypothetical protein